MTRLAIRLLALAFVSLPFANSELNAQQQVPSDLLESAYAELVLYNGKVLTVDEKFTIAKAVAVRDGKILAVGETDRILGFAGPKTTRIDLQGHTLIPGFIMVHGGPYSLGQHGPGGPDYLPNYTRLRLESLDQGLRDIKAWVDKAKPGEWVFVNAFRTAAAYQLTRQLLDTVAPNNPLLVNTDNTTGFVNTKALSYVPADVPAGIYKDANGQPTGKITGWAYGTLTYEILPWPTKDVYEKMVAREKELLQAVLGTGVTTYGTSASGLAVSILRDLYVRGEAPVRLRYVSEVARENAYTERDFKRIGNLEGIGNEWFKITGMTLSSVDSNPNNSGYLTRQPKKSMFPWDAHGPYGENKFAEMAEEGKDWREVSDYKNAILSNRYGWSVFDFHAQGDRAFEIIMEIADKMNEEIPLKANGRRIGVVHGSMRPPDLAKRLAAYGGLSSHNAGLFEGKGPEFLEKNYGADAVAGMQPIRELIDIGLKPILEIRGGGDVTGSLTQGVGGDYGAPPNLVFRNMEGFITRRNSDSGRIWGANQKITREEGLRMATTWASRYYADEKILGSIEPGKLADLVELGQDFMTVPEDKISEIQILKVIVGGKVAFDKK